MGPVWGQLASMELPMPTFEIPASLGFQLVEKDASEDWGTFRLFSSRIPDGWSIVGVHEMEKPMVMAAFKDLVKDPEQVDKFNTGQIKLIMDRKLDKDYVWPDLDEEWRVVRVEKGEQPYTPLGWSIVEMDESNSSSSTSAWRRNIGTTGRDSTSHTERTK